MANNEKLLAEIMKNLNIGGSSGSSFNPDLTRFAQKNNTGTAFNGMNMQSNPALANQGANIYSTDMTTSLASPSLTNTPAMNNGSSLTPGQSTFANEYGLNNAQAQQVNPQAIQANTDGKSLMTKMKVGMEDTFESMPSLGGEGVKTYKLGDLGVNGKPLTAIEINDLNTGAEKAALANDMNSFDWTGAFNVGLSAFNSYNQYNHQNDMMDMYKGQIASQNAEIARQNKTRSSWSNYKSV